MEQNKHKPLLNTQMREEDVKKHIYNWGVLIDKIEIVAEVNNISLSA